MHSDFQKIYDFYIDKFQDIKICEVEYRNWLNENEYDDTKSLPILLSLVVGTNKENEFLKLWDSITDFMTVPFELIISDFSSNFFTNNYTRKQSELLMHLKIIREDPPIGFVKGYNKMFQQAQGKYVVWFNDDCEFISNWDKFAVNFMDKHPEVGMGAIYFSHDYPNYKVGCDEGLVYANFGVIKKELGDKLGWFDERFHMNGADPALSYLALEKGYIVCGIPGCNIKHNMDYDWRKHSPEAKKRFAEIIPKDEKVFEEIYRPIMHSILKRKGFMKKLKEYNRIINFRYV